MNLLQKRNYTRLSAVTLCLGALLVAPAAMAAGGYGGGYGDGYGGGHDGGHEGRYDGGRDGSYGGDYEGYYPGYRDHGYGAGYGYDGHANRGYGPGNRYYDPRFEDRGDRLGAIARVYGIRRGRDVRVELDAEAVVDVECIRYRGYGGHFGNRFYKRIYIDVDGVRYTSSHRIRHGRLDVGVQTDGLLYEGLDHYYGRVCPINYHPYVRAVQFSAARLDVSQAGHRLMTWLCSFEYDTLNGIVPRSNVDCVSLY